MLGWTEFACKSNDESTCTTALQVVPDCCDKWIEAAVLEVSDGRVGATAANMLGTIANGETRHAAQGRCRDFLLLKRSRWEESKQKRCKRDATEMLAPARALDRRTEKRGRVRASETRGDVLWLERRDGARFSLSSSQLTRLGPLNRFLSAPRRICTSNTRHSELNRAVEKLNDATVECKPPRTVYHSLSFPPTMQHKRSLCAPASRGAARQGHISLSHTHSHPCATSHRTRFGKGLA